MFVLDIFSSFSGIPGEIAYHGWLFPWTWLLAATLSLIIVGNLFIPIFYKMRLTSVYEVRMGNLQNISEPQKYRHHHQNLTLPLESGIHHPTKTRRDKLNKMPRIIRQGD